MKNYSRTFIGLCLLFAAIGFSTQSFAFSEDDLEKFKKLKECEKCDLSGAEITGFSATQGKLAGANLSGAKITKSRFMQADLSNVNLTNAVLINTTLMHANLTGANLTNATLTKVEVRRANFKDAILVGLKMDDKTKSSFKSAKNVPAGTPGNKKESAQLCTSELSVCKVKLEDALEKKEYYSDSYRTLVKKESEYKQTITKLKSEVRQNAQYKQLYNDAMTQQEGLTENSKLLLQAKKDYEQKISELQNRNRLFEKENSQLQNKIQSLEQKTDLATSKETPSTENSKTTDKSAKIDSSESETQVPGGTTELGVWNGSDSDRDLLLETNRCQGCDLRGMTMPKFFSPSKGHLKIYDSNLTGAIFRQVNMPDIDLSGSNLTNADLSEGRFDGSNLSGVNLTGANLTGAKLMVVNFYQANLTDANLTDTRLGSATFAGANLTGANFSGARLSGVRYLCSMVNREGCYELRIDDKAAGTNPSLASWGKEAHANTQKQKEQEKKEASPLYKPTNALTKAYQSYLWVKGCYEARKGFQVIFISGDQMTAAKEQVRAVQDAITSQYPVDSDRIWDSTVESTGDTKWIVEQGVNNNWKTTEEQCQFTKTILELTAKEWGSQGETKKDF